MANLARTVAFAAVCAAGLAAGTANAQPLRWTNTGGPSIGASIVDLDPFAFGGSLVCTHTGVFVSTDGGEVWFEITEGLPLTGLAPKQVFTHRFRQFVVRSDGSLFRRREGGWDQLPIPVPANNMNTLAHIGESLFMFGSPLLSNDPYIYRSEDDGDSWTLVPFPANELVGPFAVVDGVLFAPRLFGGGYLRSNDQGLTWQTSPPSAPDSIGNGPVIVGQEWIVPTPARTYFSTNRGQTWSSRASTGQVGSFFVSDGTSILTMLNLGMARSTDAGRTWSPVTLGLPQCIEGMFRDIVAIDGGFLAGGRSGVFRSTDSGRTWIAASAGMTQGVATILAAGSDLHAVGGGNARVFTLDGSWSTSSQGIPPCAQPESIFAENNTIIIGTTYDGVVRSINGGLSFAPLNSGLPIYNGTAGNQFREVAAITRHAGAVIAGTGFGTEFFAQRFQISGGGMLRLNDAGTAWTRINNGFPIMARNNFNEPVYDPVFSVADATGPWGQVICVGTFRNGLVRSTDRGANWARSNTGFPRDANGMPPVLNDFAVIGDTIVAAAGGFPFFLDLSGIDRGVFLSRDAGVTWTRAPLNVAPLARVHAFAVLDGVVYAGADQVYRSTDQGSAWHPVAGGPVGEVVDLAVVDGRLHAIVGSPNGNLVWAAQPGCLADFNRDGFVDFFDYGTFVDCYEGQACPPGDSADANQDGFVDFFDFAFFAEAFEAGC